MVRIIIIEGFFIYGLLKITKKQFLILQVLLIWIQVMHIIIFLGDAYSDNGQYNKTLGSYLKAEELDKDKSLAKTEGLYNNMAVVFLELGQKDKALEYYTKEIEIRPNYYLAYRNRAQRYVYDLKDYEKAEADYTKAIELDPENGENYYYRGYFLFMDS